MQNNFSCEKKKAEILVYRGLRIIPEYFFLRGEEKKKKRKNTKLRDEKYPETGGAGKINK